MTVLFLNTVKKRQMLGLSYRVHAYILRIKIKILLIFFENRNIKLAPSPVTQTNEKIKPHNQFSRLNYIQ